MPPTDARRNVAPRPCAKGRRDGKGRANTSSSRRWRTAAPPLMTFARASGARAAARGTVELVVEGNDCTRTRRWSGRWRSTAHTRHGFVELAAGTATRPRSRPSTEAALTSRSSSARSSPPANDEESFPTVASAVLASRPYIKGSHSLDDETRSRRSSGPRGESWHATFPVCGRPELRRAGPEPSRLDGASRGSNRPSRRPLSAAPPRPPRAPVGPRPP